MSLHVKSLWIISLMLSTFTFAEAPATRPIETISVFNTSRIASLEDVLTVDNTLIFPEQTISLNRTVGDVITQTAGVELNGQGGLFQSYNIRGFSRDRIKTEINGIPVLTDRRAGNSASFLPTALIDSVYIQKGPSSSLYGSGAMGGIVSLSTLSEQNVIAGKTGENGYEIESHFANDLFNLGAVYRKASNNNAPNGDKLNSKYQQVAIAAHTEFWWNAIKVNASTLFSDGSDIGKSSFTYPDLRASFYPEDKHWLSQVQFSDDSTWRLQFFHHNQAWQTDVSRLADQIVQRRNVTHYASDTYGLHANYVLLNTKVGLDWNTRQNIRISEQEFDASNREIWNEALVAASEKNVGFYANHTWHFSKLILQAGARFDYVSLSADKHQASSALRSNTIDKSAISASVNGHYNVNEHTKISAEVASSYRFPTVSELLFAGETPRGTTIGNDQLKAEDSLGYQLSVSHRLSSTFQTRFNAYWYDIDHYIERYALNSTTRSYRNTDKVTIKGIEITTNWQPSNQFNTSFGVQWQRGTNALNQTVDDGLPMALKWAFSWTPDALNSLGKTGFSIDSSASYRFSRKRFGSSEIPLSKALLWNIAAKYQLSQRYELSLSVINVLNEHYKASADEDAPYQPERTTNIQLKWFY